MDGIFITNYFYFLNKKKVVTFLLYSITMFLLKICNLLIFFIIYLFFYSCSHFYYFIIPSCLIFFKEKIKKWMVKNSLPYAIHNMLYYICILLSGFRFNMSKLDDTIWSTIRWWHWYSVWGFSCCMLRVLTWHRMSTRLFCHLWQIGGARQILALRTYHQFYFLYIYNQSILFYMQ